MITHAAIELLEEPELQGVILGAFIGFLVILIGSLKNHFVGQRWYVNTLVFIFVPLFTAGAGCGIFHVLKNDKYKTQLEKTIEAVCDSLNFPVFAIEAALYIRLVCAISRYGLKQVSPTGRPGKTKTITISSILVGIMSLVSATFSFCIVIGDMKVEKINVCHGIILGLVVFAFVFTILCQNGVIFDACMILLRTALSVAPMISYSSTELMILRLSINALTFISLKFNIDQVKGGTMINTIFNKWFPALKGRMAGNAIVGMLVSYALLSQSAFIRPTTVSNTCQAILVPGLYCGVFLNEVYHSHVAAAKN